MRPFGWCHYHVIDHRSRNGDIARTGTTHPYILVGRQVDNMGSILCFSSQIWKFQLTAIKRAVAESIELNVLVYLHNYLRWPIGAHLLYQRHVLGLACISHAG
jgi:hypothetical protein